MKESHKKHLANDLGPEPYAGSGNTAGVAWGKGDAGQPLSSEIKTTVRRSCTDKEKATSSSPPWQGEDERGGVLEPEHVSTFQTREPGAPNNTLTDEEIDLWGRPVNVSDGATGMHVVRKSDEFIVSMKSANNPASEAGAEPMEKRNSAKKNTGQNALNRTPSRDLTGMSGLERVREAARMDGTLKLNALLHHIDRNLLVDCFLRLKKTAATGVDGVTWKEYERGLESNIIDLHGRIHRGSYRAKPSRRTYIQKADGKQRPLGIATVEDKIVQHAVNEVLRHIYEEDFLGFSYGFQAGKCQHDALDALAVGIERKKVNWILDADISGFFDAINHEWMNRFIEHRVGDKRILRLINQWLKAGISEDGQWRPTNVGTPQGGVISPLLSNIFLHYVFDLWIDQWRKKQCSGDVIVVRYADDFVIGFEHQAEAERCMEDLRQRFEKFGLTLHGEKTRLIEFGPHAGCKKAEQNGDDEGNGGSEKNVNYDKRSRASRTFDFLGFTHKCGRRRSNGSFTVHRESIAKRMRATLQTIREQLRKRLHQGLGENGRWLKSVVQGWMNYHAVPGNIDKVSRFIDEVTKNWLRAIRSRSQRGRSAWTWDRMRRLSRKHLPKPRIIHPYPEQRFRARFKARAV